MSTEWTKLIVYIISHLVTAWLAFLWAGKNKIINLKAQLLDKEMLSLEELNKCESISIPNNARITWDCVLKKICSKCREGNVVVRVRYKILEFDKKSVMAKPLTCFYYCNKCAFKSLTTKRS